MKVLADAVRRNDVREVEKILHSQPERQKAAWGRALQLAAEAGFEEIVRLILLTGCASHLASLLCSVDSSGRTALHLAASKGHAGVVRLLLNPSTVQQAASSEQAYPPSSKRPAIDDSAVRTLAQAIRDENNSQRTDTPLHLAAREGHERVVRELLGCRVLSYQILHAVNSNNASALHVAVEKGHSAIVKLLLDQDPETAGTKGLDALVCATANNDESAVRLLVDLDPALVNSLCLLKAVMQENERIVSIFVEACSRCEQARSCMTVQSGTLGRAVRRAVERGNSAIAVMILQSFKPTINTTPQMMTHAITRCEVAAVESLLQQSDPTVQILHEHLSLARMFRKKETFNFLKSKCGFDAIVSCLQPFPRDENDEIIDLPSLVQDLVGEPLISLLCRDIAHIVCEYVL